MYKKNPFPLTKPSVLGNDFESRIWHSMTVMKVQGPEGQTNIMTRNCNADNEALNRNAADA